MDRIDQIEFCRVCKNRLFSVEKGIICRLTNEKADFENSCENFERDETASYKNHRITGQFKQNQSADKFEIPYKSFLFTLYFGLAISILGGFIGNDAGILIMFSGIIIFFTSYVLSIVLLYRIWAYVIPELKKHKLKAFVGSPSKAVGFLFIPLYNFYWIFFAIGYLPKELNKLAIMRNAQMKIPENSGILISYFLLTGIIPVFGTLLSLIGCLVLLPRMFNRCLKVIKVMPGYDISQVDQPIQREKVKLSSIHNYSGLFDIKRFGINFYLIVLYVVSGTMAGLLNYIIQILQTNYAASGNYFVKYISINFISGLFFICMVTLFSYVVQNKLVLAVLAGMINVALSAVGGFLGFLIYRHYNNDISDFIRLRSLVIGFIFGFLFLGSIVLSIKFWGLELWGIFIALISTYIMVNALWYIYSIFILKAVFEFNYSIIYTPFIYVTVYSLAIYASFRLHLTTGSKTERIRSEPNLLDIGL